MSGNVGLKTCGSRPALRRTAAEPKGVWPHAAADLAHARRNRFGSRRHGIASTKGGGDWTVCAKFGLAEDFDGRDILYLTGIVRMQVELPDVREAIIAHDALDKPAIIVMDGNGIGRGPYQDLWARDSGTFCPANPWRVRLRQLKIRRFNEGFQPLRWLVRVPNATSGLELSLPKWRPFPTASTTIKSTP